MMRTLQIVLPILGLLIGIPCTVVAWKMWRAIADEPVAGWHRDPTTNQPRQRFWDGQAWTHVTAAGRGDRGRHFHGNYWGWWLVLVPAAFACQLVGSIIYMQSHSDEVLIVASLISVVLVFTTFYIFLARVLGLHSVITATQVAIAAVAGAGAAMAIGFSADTFVMNTFGVRAALTLSGPVEETTKLVVPLVLFALGCYRNPRAGIAIGLASGAGFGIMEGALYALTFPAGNAPNACTSQLSAIPTHGGVIKEQALRVFLVEPMHFVWTGIAVAIIWRLWRIYGKPRITWPVIGAIALPMALHSTFDTSTILQCSGKAGNGLHLLVFLIVIVASYLLFKFFARQSTPPDQIAHVSRGWHPSNIASAPYRGDTTKTDD